MSNKLQPFTVKQLLTNADKYSIPIYQRNYAWGQKEIAQLIQDVADYAKKNPNQDYYIGTLVVYEKDKLDELSVFETIDGQQRLTTLNILLSAIKNNIDKLNLTTDFSWFNLNLAFDSRLKSTEALHSIYNNSDAGRNLSPEIYYAYEESLIILRKTLKNENLSVDIFCNYLLNKVMILRVPVPHDTDLNHYFEIMNSRGEQLEKHEVLKAKLLEYLKDEKESEVFNMIWEACANMEKYVQYGFNTENRDIIFGKNDWNRLEVHSFEELCNLVGTEKKDTGNNKHKISVLATLLGAKIDIPKTDFESENPDRFNSVINFSNFLLHVLRIHSGEDIPLDDKRLLDIFDNYCKTIEPKAFRDFVKGFCFNLLRCKHLFDNYIIKREFLNGTDNWSLKRIKWYKGNKVGYINSFGVDDSHDNEYENKRILMLLSMFHVSTPTLVYKHWLNAALKYVYSCENVMSNKYIEYLEELAVSFLFDRFLAKKPKDYYEIIYENNGVSINKDIDNRKLDQGTSVENFIFNYLDYLLWKDGYNDKYIDDGTFKFSFRSSVEHYYPQRAMDGLIKLSQKEVDNFGNLCLISNNVNSRLWNLPPEGKKTYFHDSTLFESLKQKIMLNYDTWTFNEIEEHGRQMKNILLGK